eukprot:COSAG02_NODE_48795_length_331_cov_0.879310_1_plen_40_part_10
MLSNDIDDIYGITTWDHLHHSSIAPCLPDCCIFDFYLPMG